MIGRDDIRAYREIDSASTDDIGREIERKKGTDQKSVPPSIKSA